MHLSKRAMTETQYFKATVKNKIDPVELINIISYKLFIFANHTHSRQV